MASDIIARMLTASMISRSVNAPPRALRLTRAVNIKFNCARLLHVVAQPFRRQRDTVDAWDFEVLVVFQASGYGFLQDMHLAVVGRDFQLLLRIGKTRRGLHFSHAI